jgi:hypothetical protein
MREFGHAVEEEPGPASILNASWFMPLQTTGKELRKKVETRRVRNTWKGRKNAPE